MLEIVLYLDIRLIDRAYFLVTLCELRVHLDVLSLHLITTLCFLGLLRCAWFFHLLFQGICLSAARNFYLLHTIISRTFLSCERRRLWTIDSLYTVNAFKNVTYLSPRLGSPVLINSVGLL